MWIPKGATFIWGPGLIRGNTVLRGKFYVRLLIKFHVKIERTIGKLQSWTKGWRQSHKIKQNKFFYGMFYS